MSVPELVRDSFGEFVEVGKTYATVSRSSGNATVIYGYITDIDTLKHTATLKIEAKGTALYEAPIHKNTNYKRNSVTVIANTLIPVEREPLWLQS